MERILATDLDGTLIPLDGEPQQQADLVTLAGLLRAEQVTLVFVTGRHLASVEKVRRDKALPDPDWIICDVGTSIYDLRDGQPPHPVESYAEELDQIVATMTPRALQEKLRQIAGLRLQEAEKQGRFKLSYYAERSALPLIEGTIRELLTAEQIPYSLICSVDPFNGDGLIDLLPRGVSKAAALNWWSGHLASNPDAIVFAGDSANDLAAFSAGYRSIMVANAPRTLADQVTEVHAQNGWRDRLYLAAGSATSGVLEGCRHYRLVDAGSPRPGA